jgi:hypothetical protein
MEVVRCAKDRTTRLKSAIRMHNPEADGPHGHPT